MSLAWTGNVHYLDFLYFLAASVWVAFSAVPSLARLTLITSCRLFSLPMLLVLIVCERLVLEPVRPLLAVIVAYVKGGDKMEAPKTAISRVRKSQTLSPYY